MEPCGVLGMSHPVLWGRATVAFARLRGPRRPGQEVAARGAHTAAGQGEEEAAGARCGLGGRKRTVLWPSRGHRTGRAWCRGDGDSWEGQAGLTAGLQPRGHPGSLRALSHTVILPCSVQTRLLLPGKRNREGCTAQPGATEVPLSPCGSGAPWAQQENLGTRQLQRRRGRGLMRTQDPELCHRPMPGTPQTWGGDKATSACPICSLFRLCGRWWRVPAPSPLPPAPRPPQ